MSDITPVNELDPGKINYRNMNYVVELEKLSSHLGLEKDEAEPADLLHQSLAISGILERLHKVTFGNGEVVIASRIDYRPATIKDRDTGEMNPPTVAVQALVLPIEDVPAHIELERVKQDIHKGVADAEAEAPQNN